MMASCMDSGDHGPSQDTRDPAYHHFLMAGLASLESLAPLWHCCGLIQTNVVPPGLAAGVAAAWQKP